MLQKTGMDSRPKRIRIDKLPEGGQYITLHDHEAEIDVPTVEGQPPQKMWECDEVTFRLGPDRPETEGSMEADFASWWAYGAAWDPNASEPTLEQRVTTLEDTLLSILML